MYSKTLQPNIYMRLLRWWYRNTSPADLEMVKYWKTQESVQAKVTTAPDGSTIMFMEGEKYPFPTFPRGHILFGPLSKLKHEVKNQIFNESWAKLEKGEEIVPYIKRILKEGIKVNDDSAIYGREYKKGEDVMEILRYDMLPPEKMSPFAREIHRAWTKVSPETYKLRDMIVFIAQEDDAYRFRIQWLAEWFGWFMKWNPVKSFDYALKMLEHGEVVGDMKDKAKLLRRVLMEALKDPTIREKFIALFREIKWSRIKLTKGDKYHFRGKWFRCDLKYIEY